MLEPKRPVVLADFSKPESRDPHLADRVAALSDDDFINLMMDAAMRGLLLEPGLVNVEISNRTPNTITCQLLLHFAESCKLITEGTRQRDWKQMAAAGGVTHA